MRLVVFLLQVLDADMGVLLGRRKGFVAQKLLDAAEIGPPFEQVRREAVAQGMWRDPASGLEPQADPCNQPLDISRGDPFPPAHAHECRNTALIVWLGLLLRE